MILGKPIAGIVDRATTSSSRARSSIVLMAGYGFVASVLPVWLLLAPRDYLSSFMKIGTIAMLVVGVIIVNPVLQMPAFTQLHRRRRPDRARAAVPVRLHHDRLRRDLRLPRADLVGHDAEDDRQGVGHPRRSATARC